VGDQNFGKSTYMHRAGFKLAALQYDRQMCPAQHSYKPEFVTIFLSQNLKGGVYAIFVHSISCTVVCILKVG
jgi:hypothetical protein